MKYTILCLSGLLAIAVAQTSVASVHNNCGSQCTSSTCCGSDSFCAGNSISKRCCPNTSSFCGCTSDRAFCSGSVYGDSQRPNGTDTFGTCFDASQGSCTYNPGPNLWIVCPNSYTACPSNSYYTCCASGQHCFTNSEASFPTCASATGGPQVLSPTSGQTVYYNKATTFQVRPVTAGNTNYNIITGGNNQAYGQGTLNSDGTVSITYTLRSSSPSNGNIDLTFVEGNVSTTVTVYAAVATTSSTVQQASPAETQANVSEAPRDTKDCGPNGCAGGALCCGGQCYSTGQYECHARADGAYQLCPQGTDICGQACYDPAAYRCNGGQLFSQ